VIFFLIFFLWVYLKAMTWVTGLTGWPELIIFIFYPFWKFFLTRHYNFLWFFFYWVIRILWFKLWFSQVSFFFLFFNWIFFFNVTQTTQSFFFHLVFFLISISSFINSLRIELNNSFQSFLYRVISILWLKQWFWQVSFFYPLFIEFYF
jgi:hypothetical protein